MKTLLIVAILWLILVVFWYVVPAHWYDVWDYNKFMWDQVYSVYLERANYIHEVTSGRAEYNAEKDKSLGIQIDVLCQARGRTPKQCWLQMVYEVGGEYRAYRGW